MGLLRNMQTFRNWYCIYLTRYGFLHDAFVFKTRTGAKFIVRPWADDVRIVKSIFSKKNYVNEFVSIVANSVVVDVGANIGAFTVFAARWAEKVFAFEPELANFRLLCANIELNDLKNVIPLRMAIASKRGKRTFYIADNQHSGSHSFLLQRYEKAIEVETLSIDDLIEQESLRRINFLKLDCEGAEAEIIEALSLETSNKIEQISLEFHQRDSYSTEDMMKKLDSLGFDVRLGKKKSYIYARKKE